MATSPLSSISALGVGSGLDVNSIVQQLVSIESRPLRQLQTAESQLRTSISTFGKLKGLFSDLQAAARNLASPGSWSKQTVSSGNPTALTATSSGSQTAAGQYSVQIDALASAQSLASQTISGPDAVVGGGSLDIEIGTWSGGYSSFSAQVSHANIAIAAGATLSDVRNLINNANAGVMATIVTDANGSRLSITASETGLNQQIRISAHDLEPGSDLGQIAFTPDLGPGGMTQTRAAANAQVQVNGLPVESQSNKLIGVLDGIDLQLHAVTSSAAEVTVGADLESVKAAIKEFVDAYNKLNRFLTDETAYDAATQKAGSLQGDGTAVRLRTTMRTIFTGEGGGSQEFRTLRDIGLGTTRDGTITIDDTGLEAAMAKLPELSKLFNHANELDPSQAGFGQLFSQFAAGVVGMDGVIASRTERLDTQIKNNTSAQDRMSRRISQYEARLLAQYTTLDTQMAQMNGLNSYVSQQISLLLGK